nr:hypothetical protein [Streptomyces lavendofoliae]
MPQHVRDGVGRQVGAGGDQLPHRLGGEVALLVVGAGVELEVVCARQRAQQQTARAPGVRVVEPDVPVVAVQAPDADVHHHGGVQCAVLALHGDAGLLTRPGRWAAPADDPGRLPAVLDELRIRGGG